MEKKGNEDTIRPLEGKLEMIRESVASEANVPTTPIRQNIREIATVASGEVLFSPGAG